MNSFMVGAGVGIMVNLFVTITMDIFVWENHVKVSQYNKTKQQCEAALPRDQTCDVIMTGIVKEVK